MNEVVRILREGGVIAIPTETVYGLISYFGVKDSWRRIFSLKGREWNKPLALFIRSVEEMSRWVDFSLPAWILGNNLWPGPLTLVLKRKEEVDFPWETVGFRIPDHPVPLTILSELSPLWSTSANPAGKIPAIKGEEVKRYFGGRVDMVVREGEELVRGVPSTVIFLEEDKLIFLRKGPLKEEKVKNTLKISKILFLGEKRGGDSLPVEILFLKEISGDLWEEVDLVVVETEEERRDWIEKLPHFQRKILSLEWIGGRKYGWERFLRELEKLYRYCQ